MWERRSLSKDTQLLTRGWKGANEGLGLGGEAGIVEFGEGCGRGLNEAE